MSKITLPDFLSLLLILEFIILIFNLWFLLIDMSNEKMFKRFSIIGGFMFITLILIMFCGQPPFNEIIIFDYE